MAGNVFAAQPLDMPANCEGEKGTKRKALKSSAMHTEHSYNDAGRALYKVKKKIEREERRREAEEEPEKGRETKSEGRTSTNMKGQSGHEAPSLRLHSVTIPTKWHAYAGGSRKAASPWYHTTPDIRMGSRGAIMPDHISCERGGGIRHASNDICE